MNKLICPFCHQELKHETTTGIYCCKSIFVDCPLGLGTGAFGTKELWQELIRTRKALDKAKNGLKELKDVIACPPDISYETCVSMYAGGVLQEITTAEQKDIK